MASQSASAGGFALSDEHDTAVIAGGIVGLATARELLRRRPGRSLMLLEKESSLGSHQTSRNSGVVHAGIYYAPGSLKARLCVSGARELYEDCAERAIPVKRSGKLIVALSQRELPRLDELERRGRLNEAPELRRLTRAELSEVEPQAVASPRCTRRTPGSSTSRRWRAMAEDVRAARGVIRTGCELADTERTRRGSGSPTARAISPSGAPCSAPARGQTCWLGVRARRARSEQGSRWRGEAASACGAAQYSSTHSPRWTTGWRSNRVCEVLSADPGVRQPTSTELKRSSALTVVGARNALRRDFNIISRGMLQTPSHSYP